MPLPADLLRQTVARGSPADLARAHQTALDLLERRGIRPDAFADAAEVVEAAVQQERRAIEFVSRAGLGKTLSMETRGKTSDPPLGDDAQSSERIDAWLRASPVA